LEVTASLLNIEDLQQEGTYHVKTIFRSSIPNNQEYLQVFDNDEHVVIVFTYVDTITEADPEESHNVQ
jgi:hypothetical protein